MKKITKYLTLALVLLSVASCKESALDPNSIFIDEKVVEDTYTKDFDAWLDRSFVVPYNLSLIYKLDDAATDPNYNVVPVAIGKADTLAHLALYLWYEPYDIITAESEMYDTAHQFLRTYGPKSIQLIGSACINAAQGTEKLGEASNGNKITLMKINKMETRNVDQLNEYVFKTMHHEFGHIMHQNKPYPRDWEYITPGDYDPSTWNEMTSLEANQRGFVTPYARNNYNDDFVETLANYVVKNDVEWQQIRTNAGVMVTAIDQKLDMVRTYTQEKWGVDLDQLRNIVQERQDQLRSNPAAVYKLLWELYK